MKTRLDSQSLKARNTQTKQKSVLDRGGQARAFKNTRSIINFILLIPNTDREVTHIC